MVEELSSVYESIKKLKDNTFKLAKDKRTVSTLQKHLNNATALYKKYLTCSENLDAQISSNVIKGSDILHIKEICIRIENLYYQVEEFCTKQGIESKNTMEKFNLKTAVSLLPEITNDEDSVKKLIDSIELYSEMIDADSQSQLIKFVLKTRLTESAKLRLSSSYTSCKDLIVDIKRHLLTKKSPTALHAQLIKERQGTSSIDEYGERLEKLFVDLTISQADGDSNAFSVLKPINEKLAIRSFTDGLRSRNLSLILTARNYSSLKDTIRAAKDEELSTARAQSPEEIFTGFQGRPGEYNNRPFTGRGRSTWYNQGSRGHHGQGHSLATRSDSYYSAGMRGRGHYRGQAYRGNRYARSTYRGNYNRPNVNFIADHNPSPTSPTGETTNNNESASEFFRE